MSDDRLRFLGMQITPLTRRRLDNFRANRRGYWSMWAFAVLFVLTFFAEFVSNDRPLLVRHGGSLYTPALASYPETAFGGEFETEADYHDPVVQQLIEADGWMLWPLVRFGPRTIDLYLDGAAPTAPSRRHWLGTDDIGRDVFARVLYGFRLSVFFGLILATLSSIIGVAAGAIQGYFGGLTDLVFQRFIELWAGLPVLFLLIILSSVIEPNVGWLLGLLLLFSWMALVGVVRAEFLRARNFDYVRAARAMGAKNRTIMRRHVLPNAMVATLTFLPFIITGSITTLTALDFLGYGLPIGSASLGEVLAQGRNNVQSPWIGLSGFVVLSTMLSLLIFASEAARDAFDPRKAIG